MSDVFDDPHDKIADRVDNIVSGRKPSYISPDLQKVERNLRFGKKLKEHPLDKNKHETKVFGCVPFNPAVEVYGDNEWDRSIYTTDELCDIYVSASVEQQQKYLKKKRKVDSKMLFLLLLLGFGGLAIFFMLFLMGAIQGSGII